MKILYFDCFSGISGDMVLGAMLDAGVEEGFLRQELAKLQVSDFDLKVTKKQKNGIAGTDVEVVLHEHEGHHHEHRNLYDIKKIINDSALDEAVKQMAVGIFTKLAQAEARIHFSDIENIHFHEVGALDSIIDIVGASICINSIRPDVVYSSPLNVGSGFVDCQHGLLPVPAPAALELLKNIPIYSTGIDAELVTPTGAAILSYICRQFGPMPLLRIESIGYGLGKKDLEIPNALRVIIGDTSDSSNLRDEVAVLECNIDDMNPELCGYIMDKLFENGALDVFYAPIFMKKERPAIEINALCHKGDEGKLIEVLLKETTTLGVRKHYAERMILPRRWLSAKTPWGEVRVKAAEYNGSIKYAPEYEDCVKVAKNADVPLREVYQAATSEIVREALKDA